MELERRYLGFADDGLGIEERDAAPPMIRGLAAPFGKVADIGGFREVIEPGAFDRVLAKRGLDVVALFDHEGQPLARTIGDTLRLASTDRGLEYEFAPPDTTLGRDIATLVRSKILFGSSFAFTVDPKRGETWSEDDRGIPTRTIREVSGLYDVSIVTHAAYGKATTVAVRNLAAWREETAAAAAASAPARGPSPDHVRAAAAAALLRLRSIR